MIAGAEANGFAAATRGLVRPSAWADAVDMGLLRDRRAAAGLDISVRAIAAELETSTGRVGDLLKIRRAFSTNVIECIGALEISSNVSGESIEEIGYRHLARLSFRALRRASELPWRKRVFEVRRLVNSWSDSKSPRRAARLTTSDTTTAARPRRPSQPTAAIAVTEAIAVSN